MYAMKWLEGNWLSILAIAMLAGLFIPLTPTTITLPYAYYQLTNWVIAIASLLIVWRTKKDQMWLAWIFVLVAVVFNPIAPLYLSAQGWQIADIVAALLFVLSFFFFKPASR